MKVPSLVPFALVLTSVPTALAESPVSFQKIVLTDVYYCDGINAGDINRDGHKDIVAGPY